MRANLEAIRVLLRLRGKERPADAAELRALRAWTGWGAAPHLFDTRKRYAHLFATEREELQALVTEDEYAQARSSTLNAHYTDPAYARVVWQALAQLGVDEAATGAGARLRVLEPGAGTGRFLADAPAVPDLVGVEIDPITAGIAQALYPHARILTESFAETDAPDEDFDVVVGNVPFGRHKLRDPRYNPGRRHSIHNHFILKALEFTRPGGLVALLTSRYTLDGTDAAHHEARERMAALGDLLGAVRLPSNAHQDAAGTHVVTDLLVFRRRAEGEAPAAADWLDVQPVELSGARPGVTAEAVAINGYFARHPERVLGRPAVDVARHGADLVIQAKADQPVEQSLKTALDQVVESARDAGRAFTPRLVIHGVREKYDGLLEAHPDGTFTEIQNGRPVPHVSPQTQARELRELIGLRDAAVALLDEETEHHLATPHMAQLRAELNRRYDAYVARFGPINRFKASTSGGTGGEEGNERRSYPRMGGFRGDPFAPYVFALESFNEDTGEASKADLFTQRVVAPPSPPTRADSPEDALLICWDQHNEIRLDVVASLLGTDSERAARQALGTLVYDDPATGALIRRGEYLSGNVRRKLAAAAEAAEQDPETFAVNVEALREVIPRDLEPAEIESRLGAAWVSASYVQQFLREILEDDDVRVSNLGARWSVKGGDAWSLLARTVWGTKARSAQDLAGNLLNNQEILVTKTLQPDKQVVTDTQATAFALAKARQLDDRFRLWLWEDPERAESLLRYYNNRYNALVPRNYAGAHVSAPGLSRAFTLHQHQMAAVARIRDTTTGVGLFHGTGAGKTLEMIVGGMELTRLGLAKKPVYVVPKGVLGQFQREFLQAYPRARILVADSSDLTGQGRHRFVARWSTGNWDAVIISHTAFKKIPMSKAARLDYINQEIKRLESHLENADGGDRYTVKDIENQIASLKGRLEDETASPGDSGVEFERTGSTYIFYDEAHTLKNLRVISSIPELALDGNQITADMDMKLSYLRKNYGGRVVTMATATPVDNSPMEILTATKYLAPELLRELSIEEDDQFVSTFIQPVNRVEMSPDGNRFSTRARYARYVNQTELKRVLFSFADVKLKRDLKLNEPAIIGGEMRILEAEAAPELREVMQDLGQRMMGIKLGSPRPMYNKKGRLVEDNTLWISTDGRHASLDVRLAGKTTGERQKVDVAADELFRLWQLHKDDVYFDENGSEAPLRGSLQLAFCDLGVPGPNKEFVFYEALREALTARGVPGSMIRFAQDAKNQRQKAQLQRDATEGRIAVLVGSRSGLGTGWNLQKRVIHVMQIDPTWKATPIIQSLGRGKRQGNQNTEIHHTAIVTKKSYDPFLWQKVATKQAFSETILDVNDTSRILEAAEDGDDGRIPAGVMFAVAADRPELEHLERVEGLLSKLRLEQRMWHDEQFAYQVTGEQGRRRVEELRARMREATAAMERRVDTRGDAFAMTVDGRSYAGRREAGEAMVQRLDRLASASIGTGMKNDAIVGQLGGFPIQAETWQNYDGLHVEITFQGTPVDHIAMKASALTDQDRIGLIRQLENRLDTLEAVRAGAERHIAGVEANIQRAEKLVGKPFPQQAELDRVEAQHRELQRALGTGVKETAPEAPDADLVDAAVHDVMAVAGGSADGLAEVDPASVTPADLSDITRAVMGMATDGSTAERADRSERDHGPTETETETPEPSEAPPLPQGPHAEPHGQPHGQSPPPEQESAAGPDPTPEPQTEEKTEEKSVSVTVTEPEATAGPWSTRIKIVQEGGDTFVTGTGGTHWRVEAELRALLKKDRGFAFKNGRWRYQGSEADRQRVMDDIRAFLLAKDDQETKPAAPAVEYPPTAQQQAIIHACLAGQDVAVQALAGTGKTSTLQMVTRRLPDKRVAYVAFNRSIADEAKRKFPPNVTADTSHSFARAALRNTPFGGKLLTVGRNGGARRPQDVADVLGLTAPVPYPGGSLDPEDVARIAMAAVRRFRESADAKLGRAHLGQTWAGSPVAARLVEVARRAWADIADPDSALLFFSHDDYLKLWALTKPRLDYDVILFDEAQDINPVLRKVIQDQNAQTIVVGDSHQSIYEFRGAIDALKDWPADIVLPLTQSWRFGPEVAGVGNAYLRLLGSDLTLEGNPSLDTTLGPVEEPDAVLTRTNVGAIGEVFAGFEAGKRVALVGGGRDIEEIAKAAHDLQRGRRTKHPEMSAFESWGEVREYAEIEEDRALQTFVRLVDRYAPEGLLGMIRDLVPEDARADNRPDLVVSTAHKAKGREWDRVRIGTDFPLPTENTETGERILPPAEELRLAYVTVTRAKQRLDTGALGWIDRLSEEPRQPATPKPAPAQDAAQLPLPLDGEKPKPEPEPEPSEAAPVAAPVAAPAQEPPTRKKAQTTAQPTMEPPTKPDAPPPAAATNTAQAEEPMADPVPVPVPVPGPVPVPVPVPGPGPVPVPEVGNEQDVSIEQNVQRLAVHLATARTLVNQILGDLGIDPGSSDTTGSPSALQRLDRATEQLSEAWQRLAPVLTLDPARPAATQEPGRIPTLVASGFETVKQQFHAAADRIGDLAQHPLWRLVASAFACAQETRDTAWLGAHRLSADNATLGPVRTLWVRTMELIAHGSRALLDRLDRGGQRDGLRWNALRVLHHAAEEHISHLRGHLPSHATNPLGTYYDPQPAAPAPQPAPAEEWDRLARAVEFVARTDAVSPVMLQRRMDISYTQAGSLLRRLEDLRIVGPQTRHRLREVLATPQAAAHAIDEARAAHASEPRWNPSHDPFRSQWFAEVRRTLPRDPTPEGDLTRADMISLLFQESQRAARGQTNRQEAGQRANQAMDLYLNGRGNEVPSTLPGPGHTYVPTPDGARWHLQSSTTGAGTPPASPTTPEPELAEQAPQSQQPSPDPRSLTSTILTTQAERLTDKGHRAATAATTPAEQQNAETLLRLADTSRATAKKLTAPPPPSAAQDKALMAEPFLAALRTHAAAKGASLPEDVVQSAWTAALKATDSALQPVDQPAGRTAQSAKQPQRLQTDAQQQIHQQQRIPMSAHGLR